MGLWGQWVAGAVRLGGHFFVFGLGGLTSGGAEGVRDAESPAAAAALEAELLLLERLGRHVEQADAAVERVVGAPVLAVVLTGVAVAAIVDVVLNRGASIGNCDIVGVVEPRVPAASEIVPPGAGLLKAGAARSVARYLAAGGTAGDVADLIPSARRSIAGD